MWKKHKTRLGGEAGRRDLHKGSEETEEAEVEIVEEAGTAFLHGDGLTAGKGLLKVCLDGGKDGMIHEHTGVLEVEGQGAVVQIDGPYHGLAVIGQEDLGMDEARGEAENLDPVLDQLGKIGLA